MNFISSFGDEINYLEKYPCADSAGSGLFMGTWGHLLFSYSMVIHIFIWICMDFEMASITKVAENVSDNEEAEVI